MGQELNRAALNSAFARLRARYDELSNREQRLVTVLGGVLALVLLWTVAIAPAIDALTVTRRNLADKQSQASRILAAADTVAALRERGGSRGQATAPPIELLQTRITLAQWQDRATAEERGDGVFAVDVNGVPATDALDWLDNTERLTGLTLQNLSLEKISTGTVNIRSIWSRPGAGSAGGNTP